jgi:hypothetical protein
VAENVGKGGAVYQALAGFTVSSNSYIAVNEADTNGCLTYKFMTENPDSKTALSIQSYPGSPNQ